MDESITQKACVKCKKLKSFKEFNKDKYKKDGHTIYCKQCVKDWRKNEYMCQECKEVFEEEKTMIAYNGFRFCIPCSKKFDNKKRCSRCREIKDFSEFGVSKIRRDGLSSYCNRCRKEVYEDTKETRKDRKKKCISCKQIKTTEEFYQNDTARDKFDTYCKECRNEQTEEERQDTDTDQSSDTFFNYEPYIIEKSKINRIRCLYGITAEDYVNMINEQKGVCKICGRPPKIGSVLFVDHCHETGKVRGLLCNNCNHGIGLFEDNVGYLLNASRYLMDHKKY